MGFVGSTLHLLICRDNSTGAASLQHNSKLSSTLLLQRWTYSCEEELVARLGKGVQRGHTIQVRVSLGHFGDLGLATDDSLGVPFNIHIVFVIKSFDWGEKCGEGRDNSWKKTVLVGGEFIKVTSAL